MIVLYINHLIKVCLRFYPYMAVILHIYTIKGTKIIESNYLILKVLKTLKIKFILKTIN